MRGLISEDTNSFLPKEAISRQETNRPIRAEESFSHVTSTLLWWADQSHALDE